MIWTNGSFCYILYFFSFMTTQAHNTVENKRRLRALRKSRVTSIIMVGGELLLLVLAQTVYPDYWVPCEYLKNTCQVLCCCWLIKKPTDSAARTVTVNQMPPTSITTPQRRPRKSTLSSPLALSAVSPSFPATDKTTLQTELPDLRLFEADEIEGTHSTSEKKPLFVATSAPNVSVTSPPPTLSASLATIRLSSHVYSAGSSVARICSSPPLLRSARSLTPFTSPLRTPGSHLNILNPNPNPATETLLAEIARLHEEVRRLQEPEYVTSASHFLQDLQPNDTPPAVFTFENLVPSFPPPLPPSLPSFPPDGGDVQVEVPQSSAKMELSEVRVHVLDRHPSKSIFTATFDTSSPKPRVHLPPRIHTSSLLDVSRAQLQLQNSEDLMA